MFCKELEQSKVCNKTLGHSLNQPPYCHSYLQCTLILYMYMYGYMYVYMY